MDPVIRSDGTVEVDGQYLSSDRIVNLSGRPRLAVGKIVEMEEEYAWGQFKDHCRKEQIAYRDVHTQWRFTITGLGYAKPEQDPRFEQMSLDVFAEEYVAEGTPLPNGMLLIKAPPD